MSTSIVIFSEERKTGERIRCHSEILGTTKFASNQRIGFHTHESRFSSHFLICPYRRISKSTISDATSTIAYNLRHQQTLNCQKESAAAKNSVRCCLKKNSLCSELKNS